MAKRLNRLSTTKIRGNLSTGYYADGGGLYLQVSATGSKSWVFRYQRHGLRHEMGLGALHAVPLATAREVATEKRGLLAAGKDPLSERRRASASERSTVTFREATEAYIEAHAPEWTSAKHARLWRNSLVTYAHPKMGDLPVGEIDTELVLKVLRPIWTTKTDTATRIRGRIESVLDQAKVLGHRSGENPARWRGHLDKLLARPSKVCRVKNFAALPYVDMPDFMARLADEQHGSAAMALTFCILTAARTSEVIGACWDEIDQDVWTIPAHRMKAGREHRVPLSGALLAVLDRTREVFGHGSFVFPGGKRGRPLSNMAMTRVLKRMGREDITVHGFRSTFRDWCREQTNFPRELAEAALAHVVKDKTEAAYARGDMLTKRAELMEAWAQYCATPTAKGKVLPLARPKG